MSELLSVVQKLGLDKAFKVCIIGFNNFEIQSDKNR